MEENEKLVPLYDRVYIEETGFLPDGIKEAGLLTTWEMGEELRVHEKVRVGIVKHVGNQCQEVKVGMHVMYNITKTRDIEVLGKKLRLVREQDIDADVTEYVNK